MVGWWSSGNARAAEHSPTAELRYLLETGRAAEVAERTAAMLREAPDSPELVMLHVRAVAALGEAQMLLDSLPAEGGPSAAIAYVGASAEGLEASSVDCSRVLDAIGAAGSPAEWRAHLQVRERVVGICGTAAAAVYQMAIPVLGDSADGLALQHSSADVRWGRAMEDWLDQNPSELVRAGNPWSSDAVGLGLVKARVALAAAAEQAAGSDEPARLWWAREVMRWQGLDTPELDARIALLDPEAEVSLWQSGDGLRWQRAPHAGRPDWMAQIASAVELRDPDQRRDALEQLGAILPVTGPERAEWWAAMGDLLELEGRQRAHVRAMESAWRADSERGERANAFAWAAAKYGVRMPVALEAIDVALAVPMSYTADRGGPSADEAYRWTRGHTVGSWLDTRGWLRFQMGDLAGARADFDRALMLYRSPSATVHFHAALAAEQGDDPEVALFHLREGFAVVDPRYDEPDIVVAARTQADRLYNAHRWHPEGVEGWLAGRERQYGRGPVGEPGSIVELDEVVETLNAAPVTLPVQGQQLPVLAFTPRHGDPEWSNLTGWRVVELWAAWCGPCQTQLEHLRGLHDRLGVQGSALSVVVVSVEEEPREHWPESLGGELPAGWVLGWSGPDATERLGAGGLPATAVVDPTGQVVESRLGWEGDLVWLEQFLVRHLEPSGEPTSPVDAPIETP